MLMSGKHCITATVLRDFTGPAAVISLFACCYTQAHTAVLHISVFVQRGFQESLSQWGIKDKPQLETSHQPTMADVSLSKAEYAFDTAVFSLGVHLRDPPACAPLTSQVASWCFMGSPADLCMVVASGGPRSTECPLLRPCCGAVCLGRSAGAPV